MNLPEICQSKKPQKNITELLVYHKKKLPEQRGRRLSVSMLCLIDAVMCLFTSEVGFIFESAKYCSNVLSEM